MHELITELLSTSTLFTSVKPVNKAFVDSNHKALEYAYTGNYKNLIYTVMTQNDPYQQYIIVIDLDKAEVIS